MAEDKTARHLDEQLVSYLSRLSRLGLPPEEHAAYARHLQQLVEYVEMLQQVPIDGVEPTSHVLPLHTVTRPDEPAPSESRDRVLENAPCHQDGMFRVPKIV
jgi:aspartyl-tRNA(Asn)/glutamyl-tRNA(Gln) amidotransferase subunit C